MFKNKMSFSHTCPTKTLPSTLSGWPEFPKHDSTRAIRRLLAIELSEMKQLLNEHRSVSSNELKGF